MGTHVILVGILARHSPASSTSQTPRELIAVAYGQTFCHVSWHVKETLAAMLIASLRVV